jgi:hypothetical protein
MDGPCSGLAGLGVFAEHEEHTMPRKTDTAVVSTIGIDTGKNAPHMVGLDKRGASFCARKSLGSGLLHDL